MVMKRSVLYFCCWSVAAFVMSVVWMPRAIGAGSKARQAQKVAMKLVNAAEGAQVREGNFHAVRVPKVANGPSDLIRVSSPGRKGQRWERTYQITNTDKPTVMFLTALLHQTTADGREYRTTAVSRYGVNYFQGNDMKIDKIKRHRRDATTGRFMKSDKGFEVFP